MARRAKCGLIFIWGRLLGMAAAFFAFYKRDPLLAESVGLTVGYTGNYVCTCNGVSSGVTTCNTEGICSGACCSSMLAQSECRARGCSWSAHCAGKCSGGSGSCSLYSQSGDCIRGGCSWTGAFNEAACVSACNGRPYSNAIGSGILSNCG